MADSTWGERLDGFDPSGGFETFPTGTYNFVIRSVKVKSSSKGDPQLGVNAAVVDGPRAGKTAYDSLTWSDSDDARRIVLQQLAVVGITVDWLRENNPSWEQIAAAMVNRTFTAEVGPREFPAGSGQMRNNFGIWKHYAGPPLGQPTAPSTPAPAPAPVPSVPAPAPVAPPPTPASAVPAPVVPTEPPVAPPPTPPAAYTDDEAPF